MKTWGAALAAGLAVGIVTAAVAQGPKFFRIGTGGTAGTYYPIGGIIANAISAPPNLISTAVASNGSVANINAISGGQMESGFTQSDVAYWAFTGTGVYEGKPKVEELRAIANLYPESIHLVARKGSGINTVADLRGKHVSIDEPGSGTLVDAKIILAGWGLKESDIKPEYVKPNQAAEKMKDGALDAFFFVGGFPTAAITELATSGPGIDLIPIDGPNAEKIRGDYKFFARDEIPEGTYKGVRGVKTLAVGAQWVTSAKIDEATVYAATKGLWSDKARQALDAGHAKGKAIKKENALTGIGIPIHPGAEKFYREAGLLK
ncbi:MAG: TAXI family TRAP transporter solute-binding subunit [Variibacter sp.]